MAFPSFLSPRSLWPSRAGALLLVLIVAVTGLVLGGAREWIVLPVYGLVALLLLTQAWGFLGARAALPRRVDATDAFAAAFLLYAAIRYATAPVEYLARLELLGIVSYAAVFWTARYGLARAAYGIFFLAGFAAVALGVALFSFWLRFHPEFHPYGETLHLHYWPRLMGTFGCPNHYGAFLYMAIAAVLALALFLPRRWILRIVLFYVAALLACGVVLSLSRGSWIALFVVGLLVAVFCLRHATLKWYWPVGGFLALVAAASLALLLPSAQQRVGEIEKHVQAHNLDTYVRIVLARDALRIIGDHPWFGTGPATFVHVHPRYQRADYPTLAIYTHDDYLNAACDYGLVGLGLALGFVVAGGIGLLRRVSAHAPWSHRVLACAGAAAWGGMAVHSLFDFSLHIPACAFAFFTLAGLGLRRGRGELPAEAEAAPVPRWVAPAGAAALAAAALGLALAAGLTARGYYPYKGVEDALDVRPFAVAVADLKRAVAADPRQPAALARLGDLYRVEAAKPDNPGQGPNAVARRVELGNESLLWYQRAIAADPLDDGIVMREALTYDVLGRALEAYLSLQKIVRLQPHNGYFRTALGTHLLQHGQIAPAIEEYRRAVRCPYGGEGAAEALKAIEAAQAALAAQAPATSAPAPAPAEAPAPVQ